MRSLTHVHEDESSPMLRIGRIDYLNVWPLFQGMLDQMEPENRISLHAGHPAELNARLAAGELDLAPSSAFEYLAHGEQYALLPELSISSHGEVQSVLLACPFPVEEMPGRAAQGLKVGLTAASASSVALLRILWRHHWQWPSPQWFALPPGQGLRGGGPFLEIGDHALRLRCNPPQGWWLLDLGRAWLEFTTLPCVFGVWMVRRDLSAQKREVLDRVIQALYAARRRFGRRPMDMVQRYARPDWLSLENLRDYWRCIQYDFGPAEQASLVVFGNYARELGTISAVPGLNWYRPPSRNPEQCNADSHGHYAGWSKGPA